MKSLSNKAASRLVIIVSASSIFIFICGAIMFALNQKYCRSLPINHGLFGAFGDFVGGISGTLVAFATFLFLYLTFIEQRESIVKQRDDGSVSKYLELLQSRILSSNIDVKLHKYDGYNALYRISRELLDSITTQSADFGRIVIFNYHSLVDGLLLSDMQQHLNYYTQSHGNRSSADFLSEFNSRTDGAEKNEYFKEVFRPWEPAPNPGHNVLSRYGSRVFYKTSFSDRQAFYRNAFRVARSQFPAYIEMYLHGIEMLRSQVMATSNPEDHFATVRNSITLHEEILLFYYIASKQCSPEFAEFAKRVRIFRAIKSQSDLLFDNPDEMQITQELLASLNQWQ